MLGLTAIMYASTPKELAPEEDQGILLALVKTPQSGNLDYLEQATQTLYDSVARCRRSPAFIINGLNGVRRASPACC